MLHKTRSEIKRNRTYHVLVLDRKPQLDLETACLWVLHLQVLAESWHLELAGVVVTRHFVLEQELVFAVELHEVAALLNTKNKLSGDHLLRQSSCLNLLDSFVFNLLEVLEASCLQLGIGVDIGLLDFVVNLLGQILGSFNINDVIGQIFSLCLLHRSSLCIEVLSEDFFKLNEVNMVVSIPV